MESRESRKHEKSAFELLLFRRTTKKQLLIWKGKIVTIIQASGGIYSKGPAASMEHASNYLKVVLGFMGITDVHTVLVEGIAIADNTEKEKLQDGFRQVDALFELDLVESLLAL